MEHNKRREYPRMAGHRFMYIQEKLGWSNKRMAAELGVSPCTVTSHRHATTVPRTAALAVQYLYEQNQHIIPCGKCGAAMSSLSSMNKRQCTSCEHEVPWELAPGQKPLVGSSRQDRKAVS